MAPRIGIDLGGTKTEGIVMDAAGNILQRLRRPTPQSQGYDAILNNVRSLIADLEQRVQEVCRVGTVAELRRSEARAMATPMSPGATHVPVASA